VPKFRAATIIVTCDQSFDAPYRPRIAFTQLFTRVFASCPSAALRLRVKSVHAPLQERHLPVDLALKLNMLAECAVFVFVGAILLGAF
jgi:hypothetical protein